MLDDSRGALEGMREPKHVCDELGISTLLEIEQTLAQLIDDLARFDPEVLVRIGSHHPVLACTIMKRSFDSAASCDDVCSVCAALASVSWVAWATLVIAILTCSTAVACCLVDNSISRAASVVVPTRLEICPNAVAISETCAAPTSTALLPASVAMTVVFTAVRTSSTI